ncbi:DUF4097 domain-containing protein [Microbacterium sp. zg-YB36]|uniref:DUF4097 domain-containing protein n=1 Tax=Microbacterium sp. zg-YB36 TaxID=2969407 RepID=UPI00214CEC43|nr:DUF4097 domain-containing protein [Microbacterium sp. zg-YB36]MDL5351538.1 DUF4097 domain-containing protein [Microbacterium sp. zg-YB36]
MSTTLIPPTAPQQPAQPPASGGSGGGASKVVAILAIAVGAVLLLGALGWGAVRAIASTATGSTERYAADVSGVDNLDVDVSAAAVTVRFTDTTEATLEVVGGWGADDWTFERSDETLVLRSPDRLFGWWFGNTERVTVELPESLQGESLDAGFTLSAGSLAVDGEFGELDLEMSAGDLDLAGSAQDVSAQVSAGTAVVELAGVKAADLRVSAGDLNALFSGTAPEDVRIDVSAGSLDLTLPDDVYHVDSEVSAGDLDNRLDTASDATNVVTVTVSAGNVSLRAAR